MKLSNKILSLFLLVVLILSILPLTVSAATYSGTCGDNVQWGFSSSGTLYINGTGEMYEYPYRESPWRHLENKINAVEVSGTVSSISRYAFVDFDEIQAVTISNASIVVEEGAFDDCDALRRVYIGSGGGTGGVICDRAFAYCDDLRIVRLYEGVEVIDGFAFYASDNLQDLFLPLGIKTLERSFCQDSDVTITYNGTSAEWGNVVENNPDALLNLFIVQCKDEKLLPHGSCGDNLKWTVDFDTETLTISGHGEMRDYEGDYYGTYAPWGRVSSHITNVVIEEGVTSIGDYSFYGLKITDITIPNSVTQIGRGALYNCQNLSSITIPNGVRIIGRDFVSVSTEIVFQGDSNLWLSIVKNNGDSELRKYLVRCWDKTLWSVGSCGENVTYEMNLMTNCMTISGTGAMKNYSAGLGFRGVWTDFIDEIHSIVIEDGVETIGAYAFSYCSNLTSVTIPASVTKICRSAFVGCDKLVDVDLPEGLVEIEMNAFASCDSLGVLEISASTTTIDPSGVSSFSAFFVNENNKYFSNDENGVLYNKNKSTLIQHPGNSKDKIYVLPKTVTEISEYAFLASDNLESITLHNGVTKIGNGAFQACSNLQSVVLPNNIVSIPDYAFSYCESIKNITLPSSVTVISKYAFQYCKSLTTVELSPGLVEINNGAFERCEGLKNINIPNSVRSIGRSAFRYCEALRNIIIPNSVTSIGGYAFADSGIRNIVLGKGLTEITNDTFSWCTSLREIVIPENVTTIEYGAFNNSSIEKIWLPAGLTKINRYNLDWWDDLSDVYYMGTKQQWSKVKISNYYDDFSEANIHYSCYSEETVAPTCTEQGILTYICDCCNTQKIGGYIEAKGHSYITTNETKATCVKHGVAEYTCEACNDTYFEYISNPTGHTFNDEGVCEVCGEKEVSTSHVNTQMLSVESVLAMVMSLLAKLFSIFTVA